MKIITSREPHEDFNMKNTDLYKTLLSQRDLLLERIAGTEGKWRAQSWRP